MRQRESNELFSIIDGKKTDAHLHEEILAGADRGACGPCAAPGRTDRYSGLTSERSFRLVPAKIERPNRKHQMQNLSPRHVKKEESRGLGVESGWYSTKVSGTFVSGPHSSEAECLRRDR
jgi:hypothetical protein